MDEIKQIKLARIQAVQNELHDLYRADINPANPAAVLARLHETGRPQEYQYSESMKIRLESGPAGSLTLVTIGRYHHWPKADRPELLSAFGVPPDTEYHSQIVNGWQIMQWRWDPSAAPPPPAGDDPGPDRPDPPGPATQLSLFG